MPNCLPQNISSLQDLNECCFFNSTTDISSLTGLYDITKQALPFREEILVATKIQDGKKSL